MQKSSVHTSVQSGPLLKVQNLFVKYGGAPVLKDVSLEVGKGTIVTICGANGAGKTTLLRAISGMVRVASGEIWFQNKRIDGLPVQRILELGISHVPEGRMLFGPMSVLENLLMGAYTRNDKLGIKDDLDKVLSYFPILKKYLKQAAGSLSGGQQQMVAIGRGLMSRPKLLLADEPSLGLGPVIIENIADIIRQINKAGVTVLFAEQNALMAFQTSKRGYILETGEVSLTGETSELLKNEQVRKCYLGVD